MSVTAAALRRRRAAPPGPTWQLAALSFVPGPHRERAQRWVPRIPAAAILVLQVALTLRLHNVAFSDEGLYINAGHQYLAQFEGGPAVHSYYGAYFSGFPMAYPVAAAAVDTVGGLALVRAASLALMLLATVSVGAVAARLAPPDGARAVRLTAMLAFVLTGPVLFVGNLATYDAVCMSLVITGVALAMTRDGYGWAFLAAVSVAVAGICKYSGVAFVPVVALAALLGTAAPLRRAALRAGLVLTYAALGLLALYVPNAALITPGIELTTTNRVALTPRSVPFLLDQLGLGIGLLLALAVLGEIVLIRRARADRTPAAWRTAVLGVVFIGAGLAIPVGQLRLGEYTSFNKHLTFAALFLAPVAAQAVVLRGRLVKVVAVAVAFYLLAAMALARSEFMFDEWPDTTPVIKAIQRLDRPGTYLCRDAQSMAYYSSDHPGLHWEEYWFLFGAGRRAIKAAIDDEKYEGIEYVSGSSGDASLDAETAYMASLLAKDPDYELVGSWPKHKYDLDRFYLYLRRSSAPVPTGASGRATPARATPAKADPMMRTPAKASRATVSARRATPAKAAI